LKAGATGDYVLSVGRLEANKRVDLIVRALVHAGPRTRLVVAGGGPLRGQLEQTAEELRVADRVAFTGSVSEQQLIDLYAGALAVVFPPFDEDYGYVTLEAFLARKAVITTTDAGGPLEFVEEGVTGLVCDPTPEALGSAIARLSANPRVAASLGEAGYERASAITWDGVVDRLMAEG
jgi:glycosyltransferase involved in cell wall biosynthesis